MSILTLLVMVIVACVVVWAVRSLMAAFGIGDPIATDVYVLLVVLFLLWFVQAFGLISVPALRLR